ncbi:MAG: rod shape-determining protein RodA [Gaiellales bacterium]|jgi:rod shape determining protein RodA
MNAYFRHLDYLMLATVMSITAFGLWILQNATRTDPGSLYKHQVVYVAVGVVGMMIVAAIPPSWMRRMLIPLYAFVLASLAAVLVMGTTVQGGTRWINLGAFQFQPSELSKLLLIVGLAALLANRRGVTSPARLTWMALGFVGLPAVLVFLEPDFGTTLVIAVMLMGMLFVYGMPWRHFVWFGLFLSVSMALIFSILPAAGVHVLKPYQYSRLTSFLHPGQNDPQGDGYHLTQSKIAISHGGLAGTGVAGATQTRLGYLPEHATDFIFSVVGEERGFVGSAWLIALYALFLWRGLKLITRSRSIFGSLVAAGVVSVITFQVFVNIGMTIGLAPITGIPLPFMSFGGTHTITNLLAVGVLESVHVHAMAADEPMLR